MNIIDGLSEAWPLSTDHAMLADWGISNISSLNIEPQTILDIGCRNGRNASVLMQRYPRARLTATDDDKASLSSAVRYNAHEIAEDRCAVISARAGALPFPEGYFDLVTAFEPAYLWDNAHTLSDIYRVMKSGGIFAAVSAHDGHGDDGCTPELAASYMKKAGFVQIKAVWKHKNHWVTMTGRKI